MFEELVWESQCGLHLFFFKVHTTLFSGKKKSWEGFLSKRMKSETDIWGQMQSYNSSFPVKPSSLLTLYFEKFQAWEKLKDTLWNSEGTTKDWKIIYMKEKHL